MEERISNELRELALINKKRLSRWWGSLFQYDQVLNN